MIQHSIYRLVGRRLDQKRNFLEQPLEQARIGLTSGHYVSWGVLIGILLAFAALVLYFFFSNVLLFLIIPVYVLLFLIYPFWRVSNRASKIQRELPHALNYVSIMVVVGVSVPRAFHALSEEMSFGEIRREFYDIYREIEFFGVDLTTAFLRAAGRTPSKELASTFNTIISMLASGSDIGVVFRDTADMYLRQHYRKLDRVVDNLSLFAEIYIILAVFVPIIFMIAFPVVEVMSSFFAGAFGAEPMQFMSKSMVEAVIYLIIPSVSVASLILLDAIIPEDMKI